MNEEEIKAIEHLEKMKKYKASLGMNWSDAEILLNLINKQQKEIEKLKQEIKDITSIPNDDIEYDEEGNEL